MTLLLHLESDDGDGREPNYEEVYAHLQWQDQRTYKQWELHLLSSLTVVAAAVAPIQQLHEEWYV